MALAPSTRLGPYEVLSLIGRGGMGEVYRAKDTRLDRTVAIKIVSEQVSSSTMCQRFEREARAISSLNHPHICTLHDIGRQNGSQYLVLEYVEGETLTARIGQGRLGVDPVLRYAIQIADALDEAHRNGVIHRDLKPGNIMLTKSGVKVLDFGLAKLNNAASIAAETVGMLDLTREGTVIGTVQYMAPEQLKGGQADSRSDIFAFGAVVYEMVTGRKAFEGTGTRRV